MNQTLLKKVRCLLFTSFLPKSFWGEAVGSATYFINLILSRVIGFKSPMEVWSGKKPSLDHLRIFWSVAYAHTGEGSLDPMSIK